MKQLELNLTPRRENQTIAAPWRYQFTDNALIEEVGRTLYVYGTWDKLFGCWKVDASTRASREVIPTWRALKPNGVWRDPTDVRIDQAHPAPKTLSSRWRYEANAAFAGYFGSIPQRVRRLVAPLGRYQWLALDMIWQQPDFAKFLDEEFFNNTHQFVFASFALANARNLPRSTRRDLAKSMMGRRRTELLSELSKAPCTRATLRVINKLGDRPCSRGVYQMVIECLASSEDMSKAFLHADTIHENCIEVLSELPDEWLKPNTARIFFDDPQAVETIQTLMDHSSQSPTRILRDLFYVAPSALKSRVLTALTQVKDFDGFLNWSRKWADRLTEIIDFPPAPLAPHRELVPLTSAVAIRREAREMKNCLTTMFTEVLGGLFYFCHWYGPEPATVMLEYDPDHGWYFADALGFENEPLDEQTWQYIRSLVDQQLGPARQSKLSLNA